MKRYNPSEIEPKWKQAWQDDSRYEAALDSDKPKYYVTGMFPYPSGAGMHVGHFMEHSIVDAIARFRRSHGYNVMYPMGWDAFGLPAENYAIKTGTSPVISTQQNIENFTNQLRRVGASIDWSREINTSDPEYYKWTQWIFTKLFERGLAYQKEANQWWCPVDMTVLANEQVENGHCWRCGSEVVKKSMNQWFFKITEYADALLEEIPDLDWPSKIKVAQTNWIGRSEGAEVTWKVCNDAGEASGEDIITFTTRTDTIPGVTFIVLAPESPYVDVVTTDEQRSAVDAYRTNAIKKSEIERQENKEKTGVATGSFAKNPFNGAVVPIFVADYVLAGYGTGAVMGMGGHDQRDREFSEKYNIPIILTTQAPEGTPQDELYKGSGVQINSGEKYDGKQNSEVAELILAELTEQEAAQPKTTYKMRDWLVSRQRYWGAPIPIIHCEQHGAVAVPEKDLPVMLPEVEDYAPKGESVLATQTDWVNTTCPTCGGPAKRETDTMDGYACSSWYLLRYTDPKNTEAAWSVDAANYWSPIDTYVGGDHAVAHLLYVRFWNHVFFDMNLVPTKEPVKKLVYHGYINAEDGTKMSKSKGNVVDPLEVIDAGYGADALRTFELFLGPIDENSDWSSTGIAGVYRFLNRVWTLAQEYLEEPRQDGDINQELLALQHRTVKKVTSDINRLSFNTAIAALMEYVNHLYKFKNDGYTRQWQESIEVLVQLLAPFAPHMSAELWQQLGHEDKLDFAAWPKWDESLIVTDTLTIVVQINGKVRSKLTVSADSTKETIEALALSDQKVVGHLDGHEPKKIVYVPGRLVSIVI
jgi:leucyl-tRNA synthetase